MKQYSHNPKNRFISFDAVREKFGGRSRSSIYRDIEAGRLPQPIKFGARLYWIEADIDATLQEIIE